MTAKLAVIDWNWIRTLNNPGVPKGFTGLLSEAVLRESLVAVPARGSPDGLLRKCAAFIDSRANRCAFARTHSDIIAREQSPWNLTQHFEIVHSRFTRALHQGRFSREVMISGRSRERAQAAYQRQQGEFERVRKEWSALLRERDTLGLCNALGNSTTIGHLARSPKTVAGFVTHFFLRREPQRGWNRLIERRPLSAAIGRWAAIQIWSALKFARGDADRQGNDFWDAQYAFLASYAGVLLTRDNALTDMTRSLFPWVRVLGTSDSGPASAPTTPARSSAQTPQL